MARLRASWRTSLTAPQQPRNPQPESIARNPYDMRAPGGAEGLYAIECAMDELAYAAAIDPLELRLINYSDRDQISDRPYSSKQLRQCYQRGAEKFGWSKRNPQPR